MIIRIITDKVIEPFYRWGNETDSNMVCRKKLDIYELSKKYELDLSEINGNPSRLRMTRFIDKGFNILVE
ncbi:MAG: hypothetical protein QXU98_01870 [Candidatus Parvarchaeota archaeon]